MKGLASPTIDYPVTIWDPAYKPHPVPTVNQAQAKQLLAQAGYANGFELDLVIISVGALPEGREIMEAVATWWGALGVKVNRKPMDLASYLAPWRSQAFTKPTVGGMLYIANRPLSTSFAIGPFTKSSSFRLTEDPELDAAAKAYVGAANLNDYVAKGQQFMDKIVEKIPLSVMFYTGDAWAVRPGFGGNAWNLGRGAYSINVTQLISGK